MHRNRLTACIYLVAAAAGSCYWASQDKSDGSFLTFMLVWLLLFGAPLLFVYAYPRFLFVSSETQRNRVQYAAVLHGIGAATASVLFVVWGSAFWRNPLRDADSFVRLGVPLVAVAVFLVAACSLFLRGRSTLAVLASILFWPYWLLVCCPGNTFT